MYLCDVCTSPYRSDIDRSLRNNERMASIIDRYMAKFNITLKNTMYKKLVRHKKHMMETARAPVVIEAHAGVPTTRVTLENFAQRLLEIGDKKLAEHPESVTIPDVIQAQRLLIERSRVKVQEDSLRLAIAKIFGGIGTGPIEPIEAVETPSLPPGEEGQHGFGNTAAGI